ncbi:hypothetical protein [Kribbella catacumbae]|uniref:hypothetical protein n=1 Tax=Kribbella catacumbae TaxID=460086 RepID=UPI00036550B2|nr:hypothetical protein [Kribbella catacumbae]
MPQRHETGRRESATLKIFACVGLLDPAQSTGPANPVVHGEGKVAVRLCRIVGGALSPATALTGHGVLPRAVEPWSLRPARSSPEAPATDSLEEITDRMTTGNTGDKVRRCDQLAHYARPLRIEF